MALPYGGMRVIPRSKLHARMVCPSASQLTTHHAGSECCILRKLGWNAPLLLPAESCQIWGRNSMRHVSSSATSRHVCGHVWFS